MRAAMGSALIVAALASAACHTMAPVTMAQLSVMKPDRAWLTEGSEVKLIQGPQVVGDTVVGYINGQYEEVPSAQINKMIVQQPAKGRTALLAVGIGVGLGGFFYAITGAGGSGIKNATAGDCDKHPELIECQ